MKLNELTPDQKLQLKQSYLCEHEDNVSYGELAEADTLVTDDELEEAYGDIDFVEDDFFGSEDWILAKTRKTKNYE